MLLLTSLLPESPGCAPARPGRQVSKLPLADPAEGSYAMRMARYCRVTAANKEAVGTPALLTRLPFAGGMPRKLLPPVSPEKPISAALRC
jgi:hypothetical protein